MQVVLRKQTLFDNIMQSLKYPEALLDFSLVTDAKANVCISRKKTAAYLRTFLHAKTFSSLSHIQVQRD